MKKTMLIPSMLDAHFPLLRWAFESSAYHAVVLECSDDLSNIALRYIQNDMCYPVILITGQFLCALQSGQYDLAQTVLLLPQAGDACRGSNYIYIIRKALTRAGFGNVPILSLNLKGIDRNSQLCITLSMIRKALGAVMYGDLLLLLKNQTLPNEKVPGATQALVSRWQDRISHEMQQGHLLSKSAMGKMFRQIAGDFRGIETIKVRRKKVAVVGELYIKYCHLGNWDLEAYLLAHDCEYCVNGFSWYVLYYMDTHLNQGGLAPVYRRVFTYVYSIQKDMVGALREAGFTALDPYLEFKENARGIARFGCDVGDGWLISAEIANHSQSGCKNMICAQPFGCLPSHVCGRGLYASIQRKLPNVHLLSVDFDSSGTDVMVKSRIQMLLDNM